MSSSMELPLPTILCHTGIIISNTSPSPHHRTRYIITQNTLLTSNIVVGASFSLSLAADKTLGIPALTDSSLQVE